MGSGRLAKKKEKKHRSKGGVNFVEILGRADSLAPDLDCIAKLWTF